jgi:hypothetical protein
MSIHRGIPRNYADLDDDEKLFHLIQYAKHEKKQVELMNATMNQAPREEWERIQNECIWLWQTIPGKILGNMYWGKYNDVLRQRN